MNTIKQSVNVNGKPKTILAHIDGWEGSSPCITTVLKAAGGFYAIDYVPKGVFTRYYKKTPTATATAVRIADDDGRENRDIQRSSIHEVKEGDKIVILKSKFTVFINGNHVTLISK